MDAVASLPPYAHVTQEAVQCAAQASSRYQVPELLLHAVLMKENGRMGQCVRNRNGTHDCGFAQINTSWVQHFSKYGIKQEHLVHDTCTNLNASAYILRDNLNKKDGDWFKAIVSYNIGPNRWTPERYNIGHRYASDVVRYWWGFQNWVDAQQGITRPQTASAAVRAPALAKSEAPRTQAASRASTPSSVTSRLVQNKQPAQVRPEAKSSSPADTAHATWSKGPRPLVFETPG